MSIIGYKASESNSFSLGTNSKVASLFTAGDDFDATFMMVYVSNVFTGDEIRLGIYSDSGGSPDALLGNTGGISPITGTGRNGWHYAVLSSSVSIESGTDYWLAIHCNATSSVFPSMDSTTGSNEDNADTYVGGFADPFGASSSTTGKLCIYAGSAEEAAFAPVIVGPGGNLELGGGVGRSSGGTKWAVIAASGTGDMYASIDIDDQDGQSLIGSAQSEVTIFGSFGDLHFFDAVIDSANVIHIVAVCDSQATTRHVAYNTISDIEASPAWGTWETVLAAYDQPPGIAGQIHASIDVDENDDPHVTYVDFFKVHGTTYPQVFYSEKTGASWTTPALLSGTNNVNYIHPDIVLSTTGPDGYMANKRTGQIYEDVLTAGSWGGDAVVTTTASSQSTNTLRAVEDSSANTFIVFRQTGGSLYVNGTQLTTDTDHVSDRCPVAIHVDPDDVLRVLVGNTTTDNCDWWVNDGSGWAQLPGVFDDHEVSGSGAGSGVIIGAQYRNNNFDLGADVLISDGISAYYREWLFPPTFFSHISGWDPFTVEPVYRM